MAGANTYVRLYINGHSPGWGINVSHFVLAASVDGRSVIDPQGGVQRTLDFYGGTSNVKHTILVTKHPQAPTAAPPVTAAAPALPVFSVRVGGNTVATGLGLAAAVDRAIEEAASEPGTLAEVVDSAGETVDTEFHPQPPAPIPTPDPPRVTPLPDRPAPR